MRAHYSNLRPPDYKYHYHAPSLLHPPQFSFHLGFSTSTRFPRLLPSTSLRFYRMKKKSDVSTIKRSSYRVIPPTFPLSFWYLYLSFLNPIVSRNKSCQQRTYILTRPTCWSLQTCYFRSSFALLWKNLPGISPRSPASRGSTDVITRSNYAYIKRVVDTLTEPTWSATHEF